MGGKKSSSTWWEEFLGFSWNDVSSWNGLVTRLNRPMHPGNLAAFRILFGVLMTVDLFDERGLHVVDARFADTQLCHFPLIDAVRPVRLEWMYALYMGMLACCLCITIGLFYRLACLVYYVCYMYLFLLDKLSWNNHSYLYSLVALILLNADAHRAWSIDGLLRPSIRFSHVPSWNYLLLRFQIFVVYFLAGLKKLNADWVLGYSMRTLGEHWVFLPFKSVLSAELIDLLVVHLGGLVIDLSSGFLLYFDQTRLLAILLTSSFHLLNSRMFVIGMFPYTMLATTPVFCAADWPMALQRWMCGPADSCARVQKNTNCLYKSKQKLELPRRFSAGNLRWFHHVRTLGVIIYVLVQLFLPYSHFITKGYNNWVDGLYGYSWDMMVHSWNIQHIRVKYQTNTSEGYIDPQAFVRGSPRWSSHADMVHQYAVCVRDRLERRGMKDARIYMDVWTALNGRFKQRVVDPRVDLSRAPWHPLVATPWLAPLLVDLSDWRDKMVDIEQQANMDGAQLVFVADFPGLSLENYVDADLDNTSVTVLQGSVLVELPEQGVNISLGQGEKTQVPAGSQHVVHTVSDTPSCYQYLLVNSSHARLVAALAEYEASYNLSTHNQTRPLQDASLKLHPMARHFEAYKNESATESEKREYSVLAVKKSIVKYASRYFKLFHKLRLAFRCLVYNHDMGSLLPSQEISSRVEQFGRKLSQYLGIP